MTPAHKLQARVGHWKRNGTGSTFARGVWVVGCQRKRARFTASFFSPQRSNAIINFKQNLWSLRASKDKAHMETYEIPIILVLRKTIKAHANLRSDRHTIGDVNTYAESIKDYLKAYVE
ncbi:hypothetical protein Tco_0123055 [Tanacetum coccineum]